MSRTEPRADGSPVPAYHHGDLREALVRTGIEILEERGLAALTLREVARRAGVSHAAPYHHFADKDALLSAIAARGVWMQNTRMARAMEEAPPPHDGLQAYGIAYAEFASEHPSLFRLMYSHERDSSSMDPRMVEASAAAFQSFLRGIQDRLGCSEAHAHSVSLTLWSSVHGLAMLWLDGQLRWEGAPPLRDLATEVTNLLGALLTSPQKRS